MKITDNPGVFQMCEAGHPHAGEEMESKGGKSMGNWIVGTLSILAGTATLLAPEKAKAG